MVGSGRTAEVPGVMQRDGQASQKGLVQADSRMVKQEAGSDNRKHRSDQVTLTERCRADSGMECDRPV